MRGGRPGGRGSTARVSEEETPRASRVRKALELIESRSFIQTPGAVLVYSDCPGVPGWTVSDEEGCACPDSTVGTARQLGIPCKHRVVRDLLDAVAEHDLAATQRDAAIRLAEIEELFA